MVFSFLAVSILVLVASDRKYKDINFQYFFMFHWHCFLLMRTHFTWYFVWKHGFVNNFVKVFHLHNDVSLARLSAAGRERSPHSFPGLKFHSSLPHFSLLAPRSSLLAPNYLLLLLSLNCSLLLLISLLPHSSSFIHTRYQIHIEICSSIKLCLALM